MRFSNIALQLWSVVDGIDRDLDSTVESVAALGFDSVELAGTHACSRSALKSALDENGLGVCGLHQPSLLSDDPEVLAEEMIENAMFFETDRIVTIMDPRDLDGTDSPYTMLGDAAAQIIPVLLAKEIKLSFHLYSYDLIPLESGNSGFDVMNSLQHSAQLSYQLDTYFAQKAHIDVVQFARLNSERIESIHINDITKFKRSQCSIGHRDGTIDWVRLANGIAPPMPLIVLEHDPISEPETSVFPMIRASLESLEQLQLLPVEFPGGWKSFRK